MSVPGHFRSPSNLELIGLERGAKTVPVISIIVPTRNRPRLLARALEGMRSQSFAPFEVLVIDDGSSAPTRAQYSSMWQDLDDRFTLRVIGYDDAPGVGPSVSRNVGIAAASGSIIAFCDDDDIWTRDNHLETMASVFAGRPSLDMYIANQTAIAASGAVVKRSWLPGLEEMLSSRPRLDQHGYLVTCDELAGCGGFAQLNILALRKTLADSIGGFWTRTSYEEDRDFFWRAVDGADEIFFNPLVVAQHNVPDETKKQNLSSSFSQVERWIVSALVSQHISLTVKHRAIKQLCINYEGDIFRHLSLHFSERNEHDLAIQYARRALAARSSLKWSAYTFQLACRGFMRRTT